MEIREITVGDLPDFIASDEFAKLDRKPITPLRAMSQFKNPAAQPGDVALIFAVNENKLLAFVGLLPDAASKDSAPIFSNSGWWANPELGKKISLPLFLKAFQACQQRMFFTDCSVQTKSILEKTELFTFFPPVTGERFFLRFYFGKLWRRKGKGKELSSLYSIADTVLNALFSLRFLFLPKPDFLKNYTVETTHILPGNMVSFIQAHSEKTYLKQDVVKLNWIVQNPWISSTTDKISYPFSLRVESFRQEFLIIKKSGEVKAVFLLSIRDNHATLPYIYFEKELRNEIAKFIWHLLVRMKVDSLVVFQPEFLEALEKSRGIILFRKKIIRFTGYSKELNFIFAQNKFFQDGEGDAVFT